MSVFTFLREFAKDPVQLGAVAPSGPELARLMVESAELGAGQVVVELGAGTGPMTAEIVRQRPDGPLVVLEPNASLAALLRQRFPGLRIEERQAQDLRAILTEMGQERADRVISSLPWAIWTEELQAAVFSAILDVLAPDGRMVTFAYVHALALPAAKRLREALEARFGEVRTTRTAWRNLPPALVYVCSEPVVPGQGRGLAVSSTPV
jgi:phosphatidylethanolamine/phosphatidyl-N-methylethanolamine N-methyltransferase